MGSDAEICQIFGDAHAQHRSQHLVVVHVALADASHPGLVQLPSAFAERWGRAAEDRPVPRGVGGAGCRSQKDTGEKNPCSGHKWAVYLCGCG